MDFSNRPSQAELDKNDMLMGIQNPRGTGCGTCLGTIVGIVVFIVSFWILTNYL